jgi:hypothetical protein
MDRATESDIGTGSGMMAASDCTGDRGRDRRFKRGFLSTGATAAADFLEERPDFVRRPDVEIDVLDSTTWLGSGFFSSVVRTGGSSSTAGVCSAAGAVSRFAAVASVCEVGSALFFFRFGRRTQFAGPKLIRKIGRNRCLSLR